MKRVQKGNRQLRVADDRLGAMLAAGYAEVDGQTGKVLTRPAAGESELKRELAALKKENKTLKARVEELEKELAQKAVQQ